MTDWRIWYLGSHLIFDGLRTRINSGVVSGIMAAFGLSRVLPGAAERLPTLIRTESAIAPLTFHVVTALKAGDSKGYFLAGMFFVKLRVVSGKPIYKSLPGSERGTFVKGTAPLTAVDVTSGFKFGTAPAALATAPKQMALDT